MFKRSIALFCVFLCLLHCSCFDSAEQEQREQRIRETFSEFHTENDLVYIYANTSIHFGTYAVDLEALLTSHGLHSLRRFYSDDINGGFYFDGDKVYFSTTRTEGVLIHRSLFRIYECDLLSNNLKLVYEKKGYKSPPTVIANKGIFYILHKTKNFDSSSRQIDTYDLFTGEYTSAIAIGEDCSLKNYYEQNTTWENVDYEQGYFDILLPGETESIIIDDDFINSSIYSDSMNKYPYTPIKWGIVDERVLLVYKLLASVGFDYAHVVYEYDVENHALIYKMIGFWGDDISGNDFRFIK